MERIYTPQDLKKIYLDLKKRIGKQPTKRDWTNDEKTPSEMAVRLRFKRWNLFLIYCGDIPIHYAKISDDSMFEKIIKEIPEIQTIIDDAYQSGYNNGLQAK